MVCSTVPSGGGVVIVEIIQYDEYNPYNLVLVEYVYDRAFGDDYLNMDILLEVWEE